ncbi:hypothetical protein [Brevibacillus borstelensis]|uniref:hypothetical protein n=1 Tax=Brevibacillus borstelensis TaxID=45462 RepID=UPI0030C5A9DB
MDLVKIVEDIRRVSQRLDKLPAELRKQAIAYAEKERTYRLALSQEMMKLRAENMPATLINDVARGNVANLKFERDLAEALFKATVESSRAIQAEMSGLQSIYRRQDEV